MDYCMLAVRTVDDTDDRLYPAIADTRGTIAAEPLDGDPLRVTARGMHVGELIGDGSRTLRRLGRAKIDVLLSESRVAVSCANFDRIGRFGNRVLPRRRRRRILAGQVRHQWLRSVGFNPRMSWRGREEVRLGVTFVDDLGAAHELYLTLVLPNNIDSGAVAQAIVSRAARYRLEHMEADQGDRERYEELRRAERLGRPDPDSFASYEMPCYRRVDASSAQAERRPSELDACST
jgi:hypothetical protein